MSNNLLTSDTTYFPNYSTTTISSTISRTDNEIIERTLKKIVDSDKEYNKIRKEVEKEIALERKRIPVTGPNIKYIDFKPPLTIACFDDGTKTIVKAVEGDDFDPEKGAAMAIAKKYLGDRYAYIDTINYYVDKYYKKHEGR